MDKCTVPKAYLPLAKAQMSANRNRDTPKKSRSSEEVSDLEDKKRTLAKSDDPIWTTTNTPTVSTVASTLNGRPVTRYRVQLLKYCPENPKKGMRMVSSLFHSANDAEAAIFAFRYSR